jgi:hypothetical protein
MFDMIRRIKWKNISGLILLVLIVFMVIYLVSFIGLLLYGDCVEKGGTQVCFSVENSRMPRYESTKISLDISNREDYVSSAVIEMRLSPNLQNLTNTRQVIEKMAPGDTVKRDFRIAAGGESGRFKVDFDIDQDNRPDKEIYITVE